MSAMLTFVISFMFNCNRWNIHIQTMYAFYNMISV